ncbi:MAG: amino acid adenylation domain-containing protein, partial [Clostridiales bacterium]|nr:amino acid adenylation domain-containing protein [Clostridiales bacterium]
MKIQKQNVKDILPLTPMQEGLLFHYLAQKKKEYLEHLVIHTAEQIEEPVFRECWNQITADHDVLRSVFKWKKLEKPVQIILHEKQPELLIHSQDETEDINWDRSEKAIEQEIQERGIKLDEAPFYLILCQYKDKSSIHLVFHHILMDGWSVGILIKQFLSVYQSLITGEKMEQVKYGSFKDYVVARENLSSKEEEKAYWSELLEGYQIKSGVRPLLKNKEASVFKRIDWELPEGLYEEMEQFCQNHHVTMANLFYSAWGLIAQRFIYDTDIVFGTTVSGRNVEVPDIENTVGLFINTVPLRIKPEPLQTAEEFILSVQRSCVKQQKFEQTSLTVIGQYAGIQASELFDSIVVIENYPLQVEKLVDAGSKGFTITGFVMEEYTNYPLTVIVDANKQYQIKLLYDTDMYEKFTVESMMESLSELLKDMIRNVKKPVRELNMLSHQAKMRIIEEFNDTITDYPREENIVSLFQQMVKESPHHTAIMYEGKTITYKDLDQRSDKLAAKLVQAGTKPEQCVGIMCNRSPEVYVGLLGILKARGAYVPINPEYPKERKELMLQEIKADILLCNCGYEPDCNVQVIDLNEEITMDEPEKYLKDLPKIQPDNLAYVIYTSGSTGRPKGIMIEHKSVVRLVRKTNFITIQKEDRILPTSPLEFDVSTFEIWISILNGAESWLLDKKKMLSIQLLEKFIVENKISMMWMTTPLFNQIAQVNPSLFQTIRYLIIGGDALSPYHVAKVRKACKDITLVNGYGPTENTVFSTTFEIEQDYESRVPIGRPIANSTVYIVDTYGHLAPIGAVGELCAGLDGVGRGYFGNEELTKEKFVEDIVFPGRKMYRSGDLARFLPDGVVDFFGRKDYQVKIRGFRIELTEIESVLNQHDKVKDCAVIVTDKDEFDKMLVAFVQKKTETSVDELRQYMTEQVPVHCVPSVFVLLDELPFTENGKIDRKALKNMQNVEVELSVPDVAESGTEKKVKEIWERILKRPATGLNINFFEMGGTSLHMIQMSSQLEKEFHQSVTVVDLFTYTTIRSLSRYLEGKQVKDSCESEVSEESKQTGKEEIAVIGMAGRFPGANTLKRFYENIRDGRECISFFTKEELESEVDSSLLESDSYVRAKGVIEGSEYFDARMFGYSDREAELMDPQVRLLHECVFHAFEDGGYMNENVRKTGLFVGASPNFEWLMRIQSDTDDDTASWEAANLNYHSLAAPVAYKLNMQGPVVMNSTACSSSLVALHLACHSLLEGECEMAIAGGVSVSLPIKSGYTYQEGMIRSKDGKCRPFREDSDGTTSGDGVGAVLLKPLSKAIKDKDHIYAVIKGSAMNNDGSRKAGFTAPSVDGQCQVIRSALNFAGVTGEQVRYIETHGTGTPIGDAIELRALKETYGAEKKVRTALGSVKANIGHLDCAAGIAGFIKTALCLEQGIIPPCVHEGVPNKLLDKDSLFYLNEQLKKWDSKEGIYQAGISGFGIGGTNVHMILEEPPVRVEKQEKADKWNVVPFSALTKESLYQQCMEYIKVSNDNLISLESIVSGLQTGRKNLDYRISFPVDCKESLNEQLSDAVANGVSQMKATCTKEKRPVVFLFPGQGTQYFGVCKELYQNNRLYHDIF